MEAECTGNNYDPKQVKAYWEKLVGPHVSAIVSSYDSDDRK